VWRVISFDPIRDIWQDAASHENICLLVEFYFAKGLCEGIAYVAGSADGGDVELIMGDPVLDGEVFGVHVARSTGRLLSIGHVEGPGVVLKDDGWKVLGETQFMEDRTEIECGLTSFGGSGELSLGG